MIGITCQITEQHSNNLPHPNHSICIDSNNRIFSYILFFMIQNVTQTVTQRTLVIKFILSTDQINIIIIYIIFTEPHFCFFYWFIIINITIISCILSFLWSFLPTSPSFTPSILMWGLIFISHISLVIRITVWNFTFGLFIRRCFRIIWIIFWIWYYLLFFHWIFIELVFVCLVFNMLIYFHITFYFIFKIHIRQDLWFCNIPFVCWFKYIFCSIILGWLMCWWYLHWIWKCYLFFNWDCLYFIIYSIKTGGMCFSIVIYLIFKFFHCYWACYFIFSF